MKPRDRIIADDKHGVGIMVDKDGLQENIYSLPPESVNAKPVWHTGIDPELEGIQIGVASKKRFLEWYRLHSTNYTIQNRKGVVDSGKVVRMGKNGIDVVGANFVVTDKTLEEFPFKMNTVNIFQIDMPELHSLNNCPKFCTTGQFGSVASPMKYLDSLVGGPQVAKHLSVYTDSPMLNLETSLIKPIAGLSLFAPYFGCFAGLNVEVDQLHITAYEQLSFKGIHRELKNVKSLRICVGENFKGGVLPFAMLDSGIDVYADTILNPPVAFQESMAIVQQSRKMGLNTHDIQELLIDSGYGKYARL